jgi:uncharacterized protein
MRIWYDACTGKQVRYAATIGQRMRKLGHDFIFTTREHPDTIPLAKILGEDPLVIGKYNPSTLSSRLEDSAQREILFSKLFKDNKPDIAIAHQSVELCRTAFGLGIPLILTADTPHAIAVNTLTIPLASTVIVSEALPKSFLMKYCAKKIVYFKGVDEVAWVKSSKPSKLNKKKRPLIVIRQKEIKAAYVQEKQDYGQILLEKLAILGNVEHIQRYNKETEGYGAKKAFIDSLDLISNADLVISYGGTIAREAALQGIPTIAISNMARTYVNKYLAKKGFPLFIVSEREVLSYAKKYLGKRFDVSSKFAELDNPVDVIERTVNGFSK